MSGTVVSQAIPVLLAPVLSRLFDPEEFGVFALFFGVSAVLSVLATCRYEIAILLPEEDLEAVAITKLTLGLSAVISAILLMISFPAQSFLAQVQGASGLAAWLPWLPFHVFMLTSYNGLNYWLNRRSEYSRMARNRVIRAVATAAITVAVGVAWPKQGGLVIGLIAGQVIGTLAFAAFTWKEHGAMFKQAKRELIGRMARRYNKFPKFSLPADGINVLTVQMPVFLMTKFLGEAVVGQYNQTQRVLASPASVIGSAFSDVFRQRASEEFRRTGSCRRLWLRTAKRLAMVSIPIFGIVALFGPDLFAFVLGARWRQSGEFAQLLTPYFLMQFTASPLSRTLYIAERQREDLFWQIGLFIVVGGALFAFGRSGNAHQTVLAFSLAYAAMYAIYLAMSFKFSEDAAMVARLSKERADLQA